MSSKRDILDEMQAEFRKRLAESVKVVKLADYGFDTDEEWHFPPTTSEQGDAILPLVQAGKLNAACVEIVFQRARTPDGDRRFRTQKHRDGLRRVDPTVLMAIVSEINGFDDIQPDVEDARKNSSSTGTSGGE